MVASDDIKTLLRSFTESHSETAFAELVRRHLNLVYSAALRRCGGDAAAAQDVAQTVFADLARKAGALPPDVVLAGWLYRHTTFVASTLVRSEQRRRQREQTAMELRSLEGATDWSAVAPVLEDAMQELPARDRDALVLRFLDQQPLAQVGAELGVSEDAARMRVDRALDKLRELLARRGAGSTVATLALALGQNATVAAPSGLAAAIATSAFASATAALVTTTASTATLGIFELMASSKLTFGLVSFLAVGATTTAILEHRSNQRLRTELASADQRLADTNAEAAAALAQAANHEQELAQLRAQRLELMELRDKAARLREAQEALGRLEQQNRKLLAGAARPAATPTNPEGKPEEDFEKQMVEGVTLARMTYVKNWMVGLMLYAEKEGGGVIPRSLAEASKYFPKEADSVTSVFDPNRFEIVYQGSLNDLPEPARTIVIREKEAYKAITEPGTDPKYLRAYGFADGHTEIHASPTDDFEAWERQRLVTPPVP